jgi:predicted GIY-YIG superfamily endonuclease
MTATSFIYLLHFTTPVGHAKHYLGSAADVEARLADHRAGCGARLTQVAVQRGADLLLVRTWRGGKVRERQFKDAYKHCFTHLCPLCTPGATGKRARLTTYA